MLGPPPAKRAADAGRGSGLPSPKRARDSSPSGAFTNPTAVAQAGGAVEETVVAAAAAAVARPVPAWLASEVIRLELGRIAEAGRAHVWEGGNGTEAAEDDVEDVDETPVETETTPPNEAEANARAPAEESQSDYADLYGLPALAKAMGKHAYATKLQEIAADRSLARAKPVLALLRKQARVHPIGPTAGLLGPGSAALGAEGPGVGTGCDQRAHTAAAAGGTVNETSIAAGAGGGAAASHAPTSSAPEPRLDAGLLELPLGAGWSGAEGVDSRGLAGSVGWTSAHPPACAGEIAAATASLSAEDLTILSAALSSSAAGAAGLGASVGAGCTPVVRGAEGFLGDGRHMAHGGALLQAAAVYDHARRSFEAELGARAGAADPLSQFSRKDWSEWEDRAIEKGVRECGTKWRAIAARLPGRSDDAVRNRYVRLQGLPGGASQPGGAATAAKAQTPPVGASGSAPSSKPSRRQGAEPESGPTRQGWTDREDAIIVSAVIEVGHRWNQIAEMLPSKRTEHAIRNRWHRLQAAAADGRGGLLSRLPRV